MKIITTPKAVTLLNQFGFGLDPNAIEEVSEGDAKCFGKHTAAFVYAPMVHWPEAMVTFDTTNGVLFSADAFGSFRSLDGKLFADEFDFDREWIDDARRYYTNIVGKYGPQVTALLNKAASVVGLDSIKYLCPMHGPVWRKELYDVSSTHVSYLFKYSHLVLASVTYNLGIFPPMHNFLMDMKALNLQKRTGAPGAGQPRARQKSLQKLNAPEEQNS